MAKNNTIIKDALILFVITLISGICLGAVYELTKGPILAAEMAEKAESYQVVYEEAASFTTDSALEEAVAAYSADGAVLDEVLYALDASGNKIGYVMGLTAKGGYGGDITLSIGVQADGTMTGFQVVSHSETAGYGARSTEPEFADQFVGLNVDQITLNTDIDQISGATITSSAIVNAVNAGLAFAQANPIG